MAAAVTFASYTYREQEIDDVFIARINHLLALRLPSHRIFERSSFSDLKDQHGILVVIKADELIIGMAVLTVRVTLVGNRMGTIDDLIVDPKVTEMDLSDTFESGTDNYANVMKRLVFYVVDIHARHRKTDYVDVVLWNAPSEMGIFLEEMGFRETDTDNIARTFSFKTRSLFAEPLRMPTGDPHGPEVKYGPHGGPHDHPWIKYLTQP